MINAFSLSEITLLDPYLINAFEKEIDYLKSFDCDKLLSHFRQTKGLPAKAESYKGWENTEIRGHTLGHYLSALAQAYATTNDSTIHNTIQYLLEELELCQFDNGYLSAFPENFFDRVESGKPVWVPWYTMHKIITGLNTVYHMTQSPKAFRILNSLGDWVYHRTDKWTPEIQNKVLSVEYGGMNDCLYELYKITQKSEHLLAAHRFDELSLFTAIHEGKDILNNRHANTTIPKFLGALNRYLVCGEEAIFYLETCKTFWDMVIQHHSYVTGGNSEWEHFGLPDILDSERTEANCETCNTYNMLKLTRELFQITGDKKYADFYENTYINAILSSQNPQTGMTTYFQPMATGYFKVYSKPFEHFWCCTGTGMENFTKLNDSLYFYEDNRLFINLYLSSSLNWTKQQVKLTQQTDIPNSNSAYFQILTDHTATLTLCFRIPDWSNDIRIKINNAFSNFDVANGYACIHRSWNDTDTIEIHFTIEAKISALPDNENVVAFTYGPLVLSAGLGTEQMEESTTGIMVKIPTKRFDIKDHLLLKEESIDTWKKHICEHLLKTEGQLAFHLKGTDEDENLCFTPHYQQHAERYGIYWRLFHENSDQYKHYVSEKEQSALIKAAEIDSIPIGNDQYELSHNIVGQETEAGDRDGFHYRYAKPNGWFSYTLQVSQDEDTYLHFTYMPGNFKDSFSVFINDTLLSLELRENRSWRDRIDRTYLIPKALYTNKTTITVKFQASPQDETGRIIGTLSTTKAH